MSTNEYSVAFSEVLDILQHSEIEVIEKIPLEIIKKIKEKSCKDYVSKIDKDKNISISDKAEAILAVLYQDYLCDDDEIDEFNNQIIENEEHYQQELREKYNPDKIFKNAKQENKVASQELQMIEYKENPFKKLINRIKMFFKGKIQ